MPTILNIDAFCRDLKEVTSPKAWGKKKFNPNGLFSEQIFGPLKNYTCQCGKYYGASKSGTTCETCGVDIVNSIERRRRFAKIKLPMAVVNPIMYDLICEVCGSNLKLNIDKLMKDEKSILCLDAEGYYISENVKEDVISTWEKTGAIYELIRYFSELNKDDDNIWKIINENISNLLIEYILVLPPDLRPTARDSQRNNQYSDELNRYYTDILTKRESMKSTILDLQRDKQLYYTYYRQIQKDINKLYEYVLEKLSKKEGLLRSNILGKRVDFSGRAVIAPDPTLKIDECVLPYVMILEIYKLKIAKKLIEIGQFKIFNEATDYISKCCEIHDDILFPLCEELIRGEVCILNRQPSLHRLSMLGCKIKISTDNVIKIHPLICSPYNADFDGDQMAVYIPLSEEAKREVYDKLLVSKNFTNPANGSLSTTPGQDIVLGIYILTSHKIPSLSSKVEYKGEMISEDIKIFNECLPENYPLIKDEIIKSSLIEILNNIKDNYDENILADTLDKIKDIGFKYATLYGTTISLDAFYNNTELIERKNEIYNNVDIKDQLLEICSKDVENLIKRNFKYSYLISSGARGTWDQARQIIFSRGFISNFSGEILEKPVKHSLVEGLTQEEFFNSSYGCRKGLLDVAVNTGESGFISRKLIFTCVNLLTSDDVDDCGTTECLKIEVNSIKKAEMLIGRYFYNEDKVLDKVTKSNYKNLIGKSYDFRSPIFCKNYEICNKCYGDLKNTFHSKYAGIIAAQSLGETNTQLILKIFHTSGVAMIDKENIDMKQADIIGDLGTASKLLHAKTKDKIVENLSEFASNLFAVYNSGGNIHHVHIESVICQMMWVGKEKWRLMENRDKNVPQFVSIQSSPERESWILGVAFSYPKRNILRSISSAGKYKGIMDKIMIGETF